LRKRGVVAIILSALGISLIVIAIGSMLIHYAPFVSVPILVTAGALLLVIGLLLLVTELIENWLSKSQTALVDGLQAG
jgi:hypothetical protein